jgi:glucosylceramidase
LEASGGTLKILSSPWSPPPWWKDSGEWIGGRLRPENYPVYAQYFAEYLKAYAAEGIPIWGVTVQNEPMHEGNWDTCRWSASDEVNFISDHLGPTLAAEGLGDTAILYFDHNKGNDLASRADAVLGDSGAAQYVWGASFHWYSAASGPRTESLDHVHNLDPAKGMLHTESSIDIDAADPIGQFWREGPFDWTHNPFVPAETYLIDIIEDLNHWTNGYIEWNLILTTTGGPNPYNNFNNAPILVEPGTDTVLYTPLFYILKHFSQYIRPGAVRIDHQVNATSEVYATAFLNPDGRIAVVVFNDDQAAAHTYSIEFGAGVFQHTLAPWSVQTIVLEPWTCNADFAYVGTAYQTGPSENYVRTARLGW